MKTKHKVLTAGISLLALISCWVFIGGIDCAPPDDADLILPESDAPYEAEGNGWAMLTNILSRVEERLEYVWEESEDRVVGCNDLLSWYLDPEELGFCPVKRHLDILSRFTNKVTACSFVDSCLASNSWLLTGVDAVISASAYAPFSAQKSVGRFDWEAYKYIFSVLDARVKCELQKGQDRSAVESFKRNMQLATLLQTRCATWEEYCMGAKVVQRNVGLLRQMINEEEIPLATLRSFDVILAGLEGFSRESVTRAIKLEYVDRKRFFRQEFVDENRRPGRSWFDRIVRYPLRRYQYHHNRMLCVLASETRQVMADEIPAQRYLKIKRHRPSWFDWLVPGCFGCEYLRRRIRQPSCSKAVCQSVLSDVEALRLQIADRLAGSSPHVPPVAEDSYFPLVFTNGCYYTHDLKKIVGIGDNTVSIVVDGNAEMEACDFENIKVIIVPPECDHFGDDWYAVFSEPTNLQEVVISETHPEIGLTGGVLYDRKTKDIINLVGGRRMIVMPENPDWGIWNAVMKFLLYGSGRWAWRDLWCVRVHFCGTLPDMRELELELEKKIAMCNSRWLKFDRWRRSWRWGDFKKIFSSSDGPKAPKTLAELTGTTSRLRFTFSRQNADERTRAIVASGKWNGWDVSWGEPNED